jgi:hypothetical protein
VYADRPHQMLPPTVCCCAAHILSQCKHYRRRRSSSRTACCLAIRRSTAGSLLHDVNRSAISSAAYANASAGRRILIEVHPRENRWGPGIGDSCMYCRSITHPGRRMCMCGRLCVSRGVQCICGATMAKMIGGWVQHRGAKLEVGVNGSSCK